MSDSVQMERSRKQAPLDFKNTKITPGGHRIQVIEELQSVPVRTTMLGTTLPSNSADPREHLQVMIVADVTKSPPVLQCLAISPFSNGQEESKQ